MKYKIFTIVGTRPEIIRLSEIIKKLDNYFEHILIHTGQNYDYELNEIFFKDLNLRKPDFFLNIKSDRPARMISEVIDNVDILIKEHKPDGMLVLGDTNSSLSVISAKLNKVPIFHMEAGNRCFDINVPEELNRVIVDLVSDVNLPYSQCAKQNLIKENFPLDKIIVTGSPMLEVITSNMNSIKSSNILKKLSLLKKEYILMSFHRAETVDNPDKLKIVLKSIHEISKKINKKIIISTHPRTKSKIDLSNFDDEKIQFLKPFGFHDYLNLQLNSLITISDSGTITEESSILGFKAVNLRETQERHEGFEEGSVIMSGLNTVNILNSIDIALNIPASKIVKDYNVENVSLKIVKAIQSYIGYVNKYSWKKNL